MKATPWLLAAGLAVWLAFALRGEGYATDEAKRLADVNDSLRAVSAKVEVRYVRDTVRLWRTVARVDSLTQTVEVWKHDTTVVVEYVTRADSAIQACRAVVESCEERVSLRDQRITALEARGRALEAMQPTLKDKVVAAGITLAVWEGVKALLGAARR